MSTRKPKHPAPVHVAVLNDGVLRLVRSDGADGLVEVAALTVGPDAAGKGLVDVVSAAMALAEMSDTLGGNVVVEPPVEPPPVSPPPVLPPAAKRRGPGRPKGSGTGRRPKSPKEDRFNRDDIEAVVAEALQAGKLGLRPVEIAEAISLRVGIKYESKSTLSKAVGNRVLTMGREGRLVRREYDHLYTLPKDALAKFKDAMADTVDKAVETVDKSGAGRIHAVASVEDLELAAANGSGA